MAKFRSLFDKNKVVETFGGGLADKFGIVPFSVLDARQGEWQSRKAAWLSLGIKSEVGRGENLLKFSDTVLQPDKKKREAAKQHKAIPGGDTGPNSAYKFKTDAGYKTQNEIEEGVGSTGTSIFDPVLCEFFYRFFVPKGGTIIDPFAGGSVRGVVASRLGFRYHGIDLRSEQVEANRIQAKKLCEGFPKPEWITDDARNVKKYFEQESMDAIFSCPPYVDLERYSDDPRDISTLGWEAFAPEYNTIIKRTARRLKNNRFAAFVVGEVRGKDGTCVGFVPGTIKAFAEAGLTLYNDAVLITSVGSLAMRAGKSFETTRKLGRTHQYCLIFVKGDPRKAADACK